MINWAAFTLAYILTGFVTMEFIAPLVLTLYCRSYKRKWNIDHETYMRYQEAHRERTKREMSQADQLELFGATMRLNFLWPFILPKNFSIVLNRNLELLDSIRRAKDGVKEET